MTLHGDAGTEYDQHLGGDENDDDDSDDDEELVGDGCSWLFLKFNLGRKKSLCNNLPFVCFFIAFFIFFSRNDGGGVRGGSEVSRILTFGVPGWDSHLNGTANGAFP